VKGREWTRQRLEQKLRDGLIGTADLFSLRGQRLVLVKKKVTLQSSVGTCRLRRTTGKGAKGGEGFSATEIWGIGAHQKMTPALQDRLCFTVTMTGSYGSAAAVRQWGCAVDDSTCSALVGVWAQRPKSNGATPPPHSPGAGAGRKASELASC